uniref:Uncharacterized protein n=1 Tax=Salix viminalis TaxID=40686 RepID=A0A6N2KBH7_SALVM
MGSYEQESHLQSSSCSDANRLDHHRRGSHYELQISSFEERGEENSPSRPPCCCCNTWQRWHCCCIQES